MLTNKMVAFNTKSVYETIRIFLERKEENSENTRKEYERDIRQFFKFKRNKDIEMLTPEDIVIDLDDLEQYQLTLKERYPAASSVNRKMATLSRLYKRFEAIGYPNVRSIIFRDIEPIKDKSIKEKGSDSLQWEDAVRMIEEVKQTAKGHIKALLIETAFVTSFRKDSIMKLEWDNFSKLNGVWVISVMGKGGVLDQKAINDDLYARLVTLKGEYPDNKVFHLQRNTVNKMMKDISEKLGIAGKVTFHSLKKGGVNEVYDLTDGDIQAVKMQGAHKSEITTFKYYVRRKKNFATMPNLQIGRKIDLSPLEELSKAEMLEIIKSLGKGTQLEILNKLSIKGVIAK